MNFRMIGKYLGFLVMAEAVFLLPPLLVSALHAEANAMLAFGLSCGVCAAIGLLLFLLFRRNNQDIYVRECYVVAGVGWLLVSLLGALPFFFSGQLPRFSEAFFESVAGFTTTGTFIYHPDLESWDRGILFWRNFIQWLGGIGVLTFIVAVVRGRGGAGFSQQFLQAELPGTNKGKSLPKTRDSVRVTIGIYLGLSVLALAFLLVGGMPLFDALCNMFGIAGTGGFGTRSDSMAAYSPFVQNSSMVFMLLFGVNFHLYFFLLRGAWRNVLQDEELRLYLLVVLGGIVAITVSLVAGGVGPLGKSLREAAFMTASVSTSTGLSISGYANWPTFARAVLFLLMIIGAMGGSTAGGFKVGRVLVLFKGLRAGMHKLAHPRSVTTMRLNGKPLDEGVLHRAQLFLCAYCGILLLSFLLISVDGLPLDVNLTAVIACINNVGPGFGLVSGELGFHEYSTFSKFILSLDMLVGRLEVFPLLILFVPDTWRYKT